MAFALLLAAGVAGCGRSSSAESANIAPDFTKKIAENRRWRAFHLHSFQIQHMWAGQGHPAQDRSEFADYRAKVLVWQYGPDQFPSLLAELYFHDPDRFEPTGRHRNPDPNAKDSGVYQLHFPGNSFGPVIATLRSANDPVYLYYYDDEWAVGVPGSEPVGSE